MGGWKDEESFLKGFVQVHMHAVPIHYVQTTANSLIKHHVYTTQVFYY